MEELGWFRKIMLSSLLEEEKAPESDCYKVYGLFFHQSSKEILDEIADLSKKIIDEKTENSSDDDGDPIVDIAPAPNLSFIQS